MKLFTLFFVSVFFVPLQGNAGTFDPYRIENLNGSKVPPKMLPKPDFGAYTLIEKRKKAFIAFMKPGIEFANQQLQMMRSRLYSLRTAPTLSDDDHHFIKHIAHAFDVPVPKLGIDGAWFEAILKRVDVLPLEFVLSQAAIESDWGTSRFAHLGNNYFGQWCYTKGCGMVPKAPAPGRMNEVASYPDPYDSIHTYFMNVNKDKAYRGLRHVRMRLRAWNKPLTGEKLAKGLVSNSKRGQLYSDEITQLIKSNQTYIQ